MKQICVRVDLGCHASTRSGDTRWTSWWTLTTAKLHNCLWPCGDGRVVAIFSCIWREMDTSTAEREIVCNVKEQLYYYIVWIMTASSIRQRNFLHKECLLPRCTNTVSSAALESTMTSHSAPRQGDVCEKNGAIWTRHLMKSCGCDLPFLIWVVAFDKHHSQIRTRTELSCRYDKYTRNLLDPLTSFHKFLVET